MSENYIDVGAKPSYSTSQKIDSVDLTGKRVGLFVTCLVNSMRPTVGFAALELLEQAGCVVEVPEHQSCCGQPSFNSGDDQGTREIACTTIEQFAAFDYVVVPSGSCAGMIIKNFVDLFDAGSGWQQRAQALADKTYELLSFLVDVCDFVPKDVELQGSYTYHDSCSGYRSLGVYEQPRKMLNQVAGLAHKPLHGHSECCGFGGTFCVKYSDISDAIVAEKTENVRNTQADYLLGGDMGCLMNMAGKLNREGHTDIKALHTAEVLAGMAPAILKGQS